MLRLYKYILEKIKTPNVYIVVYWLAAKAYLNSLFSKTVVKLQRDYNGEKILILAAYQKGELRGDIKNLLSAAKDNGIYTIVVNTLKIKTSPDDVAGLDCYIEQPNYGRDFASYKRGFLHVYESGWATSCPRIIMLNDSVFYSKARVSKFLSDMMSDSAPEVLGSTENYDQGHHLGSFCISFSNYILNHPRMVKYWKSYKLSDLRPTVIDRGERKLSKTLFRVASSPQQLTCLYGIAAYADAMRRDEGLIDFSLNNLRNSNKLWKERVTPALIAQKVKDDLLGRVHDSRVNPLALAHSQRFRWSKAPIEQDVSLRASLAELNSSAYLDSIDAIKRFAEYDLKDGSQEIKRESVLKIVSSELVNSFGQWSQIHHNTTILLKMGCAFIKLDGLYRGAFNNYDVENIAAMLEDGDEQAEFTKLMLARPFGGDFLTGWRLSAFNLGLL